MKKLSEIIVKKTDKQICDDNNVQGLINMTGSSPYNYKHLQVFLHHKNESDCTNDYEFLDCAMQQVGNARININDEKPCVLFVRWQNIIGLSK